MSPLDAKKPL